MDNHQQLTHVSFKDPTFLQMFGLSEHNVLDYFALSQFYDKSSLNEQIKMQARFNDLQAAQLDRRRMVGVEYDLWYFNYHPSFFVIRKQRRSGPTSGAIYQSPDVQSILSSRIRASMHFCQKALHQAKEEAQFHPTMGYSWKRDTQLQKNNKISLSSSSSTSNAFIDHTNPNLVDSKDNLKQEDQYSSSLPKDDDQKQEHVSSIEKMKFMFDFSKNIDLLIDKELKEHA